LIQFDNRTGLGCDTQRLHQNIGDEMFIIRKILEWFRNYDKKQQSKIPKYLGGSKRMME